MRHQTAAILLCASVMLLSGCNTAPTESAAPATGSTGSPVQSGAKADVGFLLTMTFDEAKKISPQSLVVPPFYKIAADEITVMKRDAAGQPTRARARGPVFLQIDFREQLQALGQEAYIESGGEIIMRGKPLLKRGRSVVEGLSDYTVFYIKGLRLQVIGSHRLAKQSGPIATFTSEGEDGGGGSGRRTRAKEGRMPAWNVTPNWERSWQDGPNSILPALSPEDLPANLQESPLLPMLEGGDSPRQLGKPLGASPPKRVKGKDDPDPNLPVLKEPDFEPLAPVTSKPPMPPAPAPPAPEPPKN
jgi:hypothetical protein